MKIGPVYNQLIKEGYLSREEQVDLVMKSPIGTVLPEEYIYNYVQKLHRNYDDFIDGDLGDRIEGFAKYKLMEIPISEIQINYSLDNDIASGYGQRFLKEGFYPPIVLDDDYDIIDGTHRLGGLKLINEKLIKAWVGQI